MMKKRSWRRQHKWIGLVISFFLFLFCLSGIVLNHRQAVQPVNVNRSLLPSAYHFRDWNRGFLRGTVTCRWKGKERVLMYGSEGCWLTDSVASSFADFNRGLPEGRDLRSLRAVVQVPDGRLFAAGQFGLYALSGTAAGGWQPVALPLSEGERVSDMTVSGDTLFIVGRSFLYTAVPPYGDFQRTGLPAAAGYDGKVSLFRTVWLLHSGELFGMAGRLLLDAIALCLIVLCVSAWIYWILPKRKAARWRLFLLKIHNLVGVKTIVLTLFVAFTGWCLRPPVLIALVQGRIPAIPGTALASPNPWHDNLRMLRHDRRTGEWLLSAADGFYRLRTLDSKPEKIKEAPPVSVMGVNAWQQAADDTWLVGSFSGMFRWDTRSGRTTDYETGKVADTKPGAPFGKRPVAGFTSDFHHRGYVVDYEEGTRFAKMPDAFSTQPVSLWELALEIHSGRIYIYNNLGSMAVIFLAGLLVMWVLWSGYRIRLRLHTKIKK